MHGAGDGPRTGLLVLRLGSTEVCVVDDVGMYGSRLCYQLPVVLLGLLAYIFTYCAKWLHWRPGPFRLEANFGQS
jgi:hypothetical protein